MGPGLIKGFIAILKGKKSPAATAAGFATGMIMGLIPKGNLLAVVFFLIFFLTTMDKAAAILAALLFVPTGLLLDPLAHRIGYALLMEQKGLAGFWATLYNMAVIPWTDFNNTVVLGHLILGILLWLPAYLGMKRAVVYYQANLKPRVEKLRVIQTLKAFKWYQWYENIGQ